MSEISAALVKTLRERTNAAMMDCKRALVASNGDIEAAVEAMRKAGQAKADKKADRVVAEGIIAIKRSESGKKAVMADINCETDFVARDENLVNFAQDVVDVALLKAHAGMDELSALSLSTGETVDEARRALISKVGENIQIRRMTEMESEGTIGAYIHVGRIGVIVNLDKADEVLAKDIAMHIAATNPVVIHPEDVPADLVAKERDIFSAQAASSGKPAEIVEKMIAGRIKKYLDEVSLLGQAFIKDPEQSIGQLLAKANAKVVSFTRFEVGEGVEKKVDNFVEEVMAQARA
jgi:elongation factor Ts